MIFKRSACRIGLCLWLSILITPPAATAQTTQPTEPADQPAYWLARAGHSIREIVDPDDPDYARLIRAQAFSLLARCADDLGDTDRYRSAIQTAAASAAEIADADLRNEARWSLAEAFAESGRFDEAKKTVDAITDPAARASARMTLAVAHARLGQQADYQRTSAASQRALIDAHVTDDPDDPFDDAGWAWLSLVGARLQADDTTGALALTDHLPHPADLTAALASVSEKQAELGDKQAATATLDRAQKSLHRLQAVLKENPDTFADTDAAYAALARAHAALGRREQADEMLARIDMTDVQAENLSACAVHLARLGQTSQARDALDQARALLDQPAQPLWINHWSWFEVSKNSTLAGDLQATTRWIESLEDPTTRALAELGALRGLIERAKHNP